MASIALINPPSPFLLDDNVMPPLGIMYLSSYLKEHGQEPKIIDLAVNPATNIKGFDIYAITSTTPQYPKALEILNILKEKNPQSIFVIGGAHATAFKEKCRNEFDSVVIGEGEEALLAISRFVDNSENCRITGLVNARQIPNIDEIPFPDRSFSGFDKYHYNINGLPTTTMLTSRGCPFHCYFCLPKGTLVLTEDLTYIPIEQIKVGDILVGIIKKDHFISYERSRVLDTFKRRDRIYKIKTMIGDVQSTLEHPWLSDHYRWRKTERFVPGQFLRKVSTPIKLPKETREYKIGYIAGAFDGDGHMEESMMTRLDPWKLSKMVIDSNYKYSIAKLVGDYDMMSTILKYSNELGIDLHEGPYDGEEWSLDKCIVSYRKEIVDYIDKMRLEKTLENSDEFKRGYLAGIYDAEGSWPRNSEDRWTAYPNTLRIFNSDERILNRISEYLHYFGFQTELDFELGNLSTSAVRILGGLNKILLFFSLVNPKVGDKKLQIFDYHLKSKDGYAQILDICPGDICEVYNLETTTGNFIADGFITHNCCNTWGNKVRLRSAENILDEVEYLKDMGFKAIMFFDDTFTINKKRVVEIAKGLKNLDMLWRCFIHASTVDRNLLEYMKECGCVEVGMGVESGSPEILKTINKKINRELVQKICKHCHEIGLRIKTFLMCGLPGECHQSINSTIKFLETARPNNYDITIYTPFPNTEIWNNSEQFDIQFDKNKLDYSKMFFKGKAGKYFCQVSTSKLNSEEIEIARDYIENLKGELCR